MFNVAYTCIVPKQDAIIGISDTRRIQTLRLAIHIVLITNAVKLNLWFSVPGCYQQRQTVNTTWAQVTID